MGRYGSPRLHRSLLTRGVRCCVNAVAKAMRALGLAASRPRRRPRPPGPGDATPNALGRQFAAAGPDEEPSIAPRRPATGPSCFSRRGNCWDNAPMESFFASLKKELVCRESFATRSATERSIFEYIEVFYNRVRLHSALGYVAPATFESLQP